MKNYLLMKIYNQLKEILINNGITPAEGYFILQTLLSEIKEILDIAINGELQNTKATIDEEHEVPIEFTIEKEETGQE